MFHLGSGGEDDGPGEVRFTVERVVDGGDGVVLAEFVCKFPGTSGKLWCFYTGCADNRAVRCN